MSFAPTYDQRSVLLALRFTKDKNAGTTSQGDVPRHIEAISALFAAPDITIVEQFDGDEAALLDAFWRSMRRNDRVFVADAVNALAFLRERSWRLSVIPALGIDLNAVYNLISVDITVMCGPRRPHADPAIVRRLKNKFQPEYITAK